MVKAIARERRIDQAKRVEMRIPEVSGRPCALGSGRQARRFHASTSRIDHDVGARGCGRVGELLQELECFFTVRKQPDLSHGSE